MKNQRVLPRGWWIWWALLTALPGIGMNLNFFYVLGLEDSYLFFFLLLSTLLMGVGQGALLYHRIRQPILWGVITFLGYSASNALYIVFIGLAYWVGNAMFDIGASFVVGFIGIAIPIIAQFILLRKLPKSGWWIPTGILSFSLFAVSGGIKLIIDTFDYDWVYSILLGVMHGIPTGLVLQYILNQVDNQYGYTPPKWLYPIVVLIMVVFFFAVMGLIGYLLNNIGPL